MTVTRWRGLADNVASSVKKGDPLLVFGRMRVRRWDRADREGSTVEIDAYSIGHDMTRGTSAFLKHKETQPEQAQTDEQANQVRWNVEEEGLNVERAVAAWGDDLGDVQYSAPGGAAALITRF